MEVTMMDKICRTYAWPELKQVQLDCTLHRIQLNKNGVQWLNCNFVCLKINNKHQLIIQQVDGRSPFAFALSTTLTITNSEALAKILPQRIKNKHVRQTKIYGHRDITKTNQPVLIFDLQD